MPARVNITRFKIILILGCTTLIFYFEIGSKKEEEVTLGPTDAFRRSPLILLYNTWHRETIERYPWKKVVGNIWELPSCPARCIYTMDRETFGATADLLFATGSGLTDFQGVMQGLRHQIELNNSSNQMWVWGSLEPAQYNWRISDRVIDSHFHWTAAYRNDADIPWPYGELRQVSPRESLHPPGLFKKKKMAAWMVSRCDAESGRQDLVKSLQKYLPVDVYGSCGVHCPGDNLSCRDFLSNNYKFYLAFENSFCFEYTTEKFFYALGRMIPITLGWNNYSRFAPPHSYINALDFSSVRELAEYLKYVGEREDEYLKYFEWTRNFEVFNDTLAIGLCNACKKYLSHFSSPEIAPPERHSSPSNWFYSLPRNPDGSEGNRTLRVGDASITTKDICIVSKANKVLSSWIHDQSSTPS